MASSSSGAPREIETKFRVEDRRALESRLAALGAVPSGSEHETNVLFDDDAATLKTRGAALRLRTTEESENGLLTFKGKATMSSGVKSRMELETEVESPDTLRRILRELGFTPRFTYEKRRTTWRFADPARPLVVVDETPIGLFAEIEGKEAAVRSLARELGVPRSALLHESYVSLYLAARRADPALPEDMTFRRPREARRPKRSEARKRREKPA